MTRISIGAAFAAALAGTMLTAGLGAAQAGAQTANFAGATPDATTLYFTTTERVLATDTDSLTDVYQRSGGVTTLVSVPGVGASGAGASASWNGASADGLKVFFSTAENLVAADTDGLNDVYERSGGTTTLVSVPGVGSSGPAQFAGFSRVSTDGSRVFFSTNENLVTADTDGLNDVYERSGVTTTLISVEGVGSSGPAQGVQLLNISSDGTRVFLSTTQNYIAADTDGLNDIYERTGVTTSLVSAPGAGASGPDQLAGLSYVSTDGMKAFFVTAQNMVTADTDGLSDGYLRSGGTTTLVTEPGAGATPPAKSASIQGITPDGSMAIWDTDENLVAADTDGLSDAYVNSGAGTTALVSVPGVGASGPDFDVTAWEISTDGGTVIFDTDQNMVAADTDGLTDIYSRSGGTTTLLSVIGVGASGPSDSVGFQDASDDGSRVFFETDQNLVTADVDGLQDVYEASGGGVSLASAPGAGASGSASPQQFRRISSDGTRLIFDTTEKLTGADQDTFFDIYERFGGTTTLLSGEPGPPLGGPPETTITSGPPGSSTTTTAAFSFSSSETPSTFECSLDGAGFSACTSPVTTPVLAIGPHTFAVQATDFAGNVDATPAQSAFSIVAPAVANPPAQTPAGPTGKRAAALKKCKKKRGRARARCKRAANKLPV